MIRTKNLPHDRRKCECSDPGCPAHQGRSECGHTQKLVKLYRVDMDDTFGTVFCEECAQDALEAMLYGDEPLIVPR